MIIIIRFIVKNHGNFFWNIISQITYSMCNISVFTITMTMLPKFAIVFIISVFLYEVFLQMQCIFVFSYDSCCFFVNGIIYFFSKLIIFIACSLKGALYGPRQCLVIESSLRMMKNTFYFTLKALFVERCLSFCHDFLVM